MRRNLLLGILSVIIIITSYSHFTDEPTQAVLTASSDSTYHETAGENVSVEDSINALIETFNFDLKEHVIDSIFQRRAKHNAFNGVILAAQKGQVIYEEAFGWANTSKKEKMQKDHVFQLASVSKQFTAASVMLLKQKGLLAYEDTIQQYIPNFPYEGITIRQLLTHRSGLPNYIYKAEEYYPKSYHHDSVVSNEEIMEMLIADPPNKYGQPDGRFLYSNTGYIVLASIVEEVSGLPFDVFLKKEIFEPLGMKNTFARSVQTPKEQLEKVVQGYTARRRPYRDYFLDTVMGDKSVYSTAYDMFLWDKALLDGTIIQKDILADAFEKGSPKKRGKYNYGFGYRLYETTDGKTVVYHTGWWKGFSTLFVHYPESESCLIILTNRLNKSYYNINMVLDTLAIPEYHRT
ncbi:serine hydrolase domain-containing protein [Sediminitomix flava]|nr:serine hydrolase domain-containing protein [Sediminitomix flava]